MGRSSVLALTLLVSCSTAASDAGGIAPAPTTSNAAATDAGAERTLEVRDEWGAVFDESGVVGTIAVREVGSDETLVWNIDRAGERRRPASTFKILNSLIILEAGVLADVDTVVPWDGVEREVPAWNRDHTLRSGIEVSAVWLYQVLARQVGLARMSDWIDQIRYGNEVLGGEIDDFWLSGDLKISPIEQLDFLERLATGDLPFRPEVIDAVTDIIVQERGEGWSWSYKTGTALAEDPDLGWLVGMTERGDRQWVFALNIDLGTIDGLEGQIVPASRQQIAGTILRMAGALPG